MFKELLPAYLEGKLDSQRVAAVEEFFKNKTVGLTDVENFKGQIEFLEKFSKVKPTPEITKFIMEHDEDWQHLLKKYSYGKWPSPLRWGTQLLMVGLLVVLTVHLFPWLNLARSLKNIKPKAPVLKQLTKEDVPMLPTKVIYGPMWPKDMPSPEAYAKQWEETKKKNAAIADIVAKSDEENSSTATEDEVSNVYDGGYVWRGRLKLKELTEDETVEITKKIVELGGAKAGQVELGWIKGETRYYHFTIPSDNYTKLQQMLVEHGALDLKREQHPRIMKKGTMRIIMSIEAEK